ncbi:MAG: hypothetical protein B7733_13025 [Myxococcales bacterium FL481]|nr:MAG: hypothetical protein B7733_13025 [Myxococcales bacterium FL481]
MTAVHVNLPGLYDAQHDAFFNDARYSVCEATTKGGKTLGALVWLASELLKDPRPLNWWWVAPVYTQAEIGYRRAKKMFDGIYERANDTNMYLLFSGGKRWVFKSAEKPDNLYGEDVAAAVLDEFTRMREDAWIAVRSTLTATNGPIRMIGNVKGRGNWGYRIARKAQGRAKGYHYSKITADDAVAAGVFSNEELDDAQQALPHDVFRELYYCEPADDGGNPFGIEAIGRVVGPLSDRRAAVYGVDLAKSVDWTVITGLDSDGRVCYFDRWQRRSWDETEAALVAQIGDTPALVDSTGVGDPIYERLARRCPQVEPFVFSSNRKQQLMEGEAVAIQQQRTTILEGVMRNEFEAFEYNVTSTNGRVTVRYTAPDGCHDDCVCSHALAVHKLGQIVPVSASVVWHGKQETTDDPDEGLTLAEIERRRVREFAMGGRI